MARRAHSDSPLGGPVADGSTRRRDPDETRRYRRRRRSGQRQGSHVAAAVGSSCGDRRRSDRVAVLLEAAGPAELASAIADTYGFTERERMVTELVAHGLSTSEIADRLHLSAYTVQDHLKAIFDKSATGSRGELVAQALLRPLRTSYPFGRRRRRSEHVVARGQHASWIELSLGATKVVPPIPEVATPVAT